MESETFCESQISDPEPTTMTIPRNDDMSKKLDDPLYHERQNWIQQMEKDFPDIPYYFLDLITSYVQAHPEEADKVMRGELKFESTKLDEWRKSVKENNIDILQNDKRD